MTPGKPKPQPANRPIRRCQHCPKLVQQHPSGWWLDEEGCWYCMRIGGRPLAHTPMPAIREAS